MCEAPKTHHHHDHMDSSNGGGGGDGDGQHSKQKQPHPLTPYPDVRRFSTPYPPIIGPQYKRSRVDDHSSHSLSDAKNAGSVHFDHHHHHHHSKHVSTPHHMVSTSSKYDVSSLAPSFIASPETQTSIASATTATFNNNGNDPMEELMKKLNNLINKLISNLDARIDNLREQFRADLIQMSQNQAPTTTSTTPAAPSAADSDNGVAHDTHRRSLFLNETQSSEDDSDDDDDDIECIHTNDNNNNFDDGFNLSYNP